MIRNNPWIQFWEMFVALLLSIVAVLTFPVVIVLWIWVAWVSTIQEMFGIKKGGDEDV